MLSDAAVEDGVEGPAAREHVPPRALAHLLRHVQRVEGEHAALGVQLRQQHVQAGAAAELAADRQQALVAEGRDEARREAERPVGAREKRACA